MTRIDDTRETKSWLLTDQDISDQQDIQKEFKTLEANLEAADRVAAPKSNQNETRETNAYSSETAVLYIINYNANQSIEYIIKKTILATIEAGDIFQIAVVGYNHNDEKVEPKEPLPVPFYEIIKSAETGELGARPYFSNKVLRALYESDLPRLIGDVVKLEDGRKLSEVDGAKVYVQVMNHVPHTEEGLVRIAKKDPYNQLDDEIKAKARFRELQEDFGFSVIHTH